MDVRLPDSFYDIVDALGIVQQNTYVAAGCGECVSGHSPVVTLPICTKKVILTCDDGLWNAVCCTTTPGDVYHLCKAL